MPRIVTGVTDFKDQILNALIEEATSTNILKKQDTRPGSDDSDEARQRLLAEMIENLGLNGSCSSCVISLSDSFRPLNPNSKHPTIWIYLDLFGRCCSYNVLMK